MPTCASCIGTATPRRSRRGCSVCSKSIRDFDSSVGACSPREAVAAGRAGSESERTQLGSRCLCCAGAIVPAGRALVSIAPPRRCGRVTARDHRLPEIVPTSALARPSDRPSESTGLVPEQECRRAGSRRRGHPLSMPPRLCGGRGLFQHGLSVPATSGRLRGARRPSVVTAPDVSKLENLRPWEKE